MLAAVGLRAASSVCRIAASRSSTLRSAGAAAAGMTAIGAFCTTAHAAADALPDLDDPVDYFKPNREHGAAMYKLVKEGSLDDNSPYAYIMMSNFYADTCIVAKHKKTGQILGFVMGFRPPTDPSSLFVWQVGADEAARGMGLASRMILELAAANAPKGVTKITATVTPTNEASQNLFKGLASKLHCNVDEHRNMIRVTDFPVDALHEAEDLFTVGPFTPRAAAAALHEAQQKQRHRAKHGGGVDAAGNKSATAHGR